MPSDPELSGDAQAYQELFAQILQGSAGFFYPYHYVQQGFSCNVWAASDRSSTYIRAVAQLPDLVHRDVRFMTVRPEDTGPTVGTELPFDGGVLVVRMYNPPDPISGEAVIVCHWEA